MVEIKNSAAFYDYVTLKLLSDLRNTLFFTFQGKHITLSVQQSREMARETMRDMMRLRADLHVRGNIRASTSCN